MRYNADMISGFGISAEKIYERIYAISFTCRNYIVFIASSYGS